MQIIEGEGFEFKAEKKKVNARILVIDPDLAFLVLRWLNRSSTVGHVDRNESPDEQTQEHTETCPS